MASSILPNTSNFLAVALVISRSRDGPGFVFHYPPHVPPIHCKTALLDDDNDEDDVLVERASKIWTNDAINEPRYHDQSYWNYEDHTFNEEGEQIAPWDHVAGFPTQDLGNILTPGRSWHKRLFQVSLDPIYCVSYPIYVPESGVWRKKKKQTKIPKQGEEEKDPEYVHKVISLEDEADNQQKTNKVESIEEKKSSMTMFNLVFFLNPQKHEAKELINIMFQNIIKKVNRAYKYSQQRCDFVWKESKRILQLKERGIANRTKIGVVWDEILSDSSLAASMQEIYEAVTQQKIAALQLELPEGRPIHHSVQISMPFYIEDLPDDSKSEAATKGLCLTTASTFGLEEAFEDPIYMAKNFALLLLDDERRIVSELEAETEKVDQDILKMIKFVRQSRPTLSFYQVAQSHNNLSLGEVQEFTRHFIYWRRGIAIPPLHARDVYILSPNCDTTRLPRAAEEWKRRFPGAPSLPTFLAELSFSPRPYKSFSSKTNRPLYLEMLAWLMRGGWVTQLCTYAYVVVWPEIIYEVEYAMEQDVINKQQEAILKGQEASNSESSSASSSPVISCNEDEESSDADTAIQRSTEDLSRPHFSPLSSLSASRLERSDSSASGLQETGTTSQTSPLPQIAMPPSPILPKRAFGSTTSLSNTSASARLRNHNHHTHHYHSHNAHIDTPPTVEQVAEQARKIRIADRKQREAAEKAATHARRPKPQATAHPSTNTSHHLAGIEPYIILDPKKAKSDWKVSLFLDAIKKRLEGSIPTVADLNGRSPGNLLSVPPTLATGTASSSSLAGIPITPSGNQEFGSASGCENGTGPTSAAVVGDDDNRVAEAWRKFERYFNGRYALERIALMEDMKRKEVWTLLTGMSEYLLTVRHW